MTLMLRNANYYGFFYILLLYKNQFHLRFAQANLFHPRANSKKVFVTLIFKSFLMKKLTFEIEINAPADKVWNAMWEEENYKKWN